MLDVIKYIIKLIMKLLRIRQPRVARLYSREDVALKVRLIGSRAYNSTVNMSIYSPDYIYISMK